MKYLLFFLILMITYHQANCQHNISVSNYENIARNETDFINSLLKLNQQQKDSISKENTIYYFTIARVNAFSLEMGERKKELDYASFMRTNGLQRILSRTQYQVLTEINIKQKLHWKNFQDSLKNKHH